MLAIKAVKLIDGTGRAPLEEAVVLVEGAMIAQVGRADAVAIPLDGQVIDASGMTVLPGLIDAHVHVQSPGGEEAKSSWLIAEATELLETTALRSYVHARQDLLAGFTAVRDLGARGYVAVALRDAINSGLLSGPRMRACGQGLTTTGGHMDQVRWRPGVTITDGTGVADSPWAFRQAVRHQLKMGADCIKMNVSDRPRRSGREPDEPYLQELTFEEMTAVCTEAHKAQVRVAAHSSGGQGITDAILAGVDSLEHAHWLTEEQCDRMAEHETFYVPTFSVVARQLSVGREALGASESVWTWLNRATEAKALSLERARRAGVRIAAGTDAGFAVAHGENAAELELLVQGGMSPMEAIEAATRVGAELLDMADLVGTIEPGKRADLLIVDGDPLRDIRILKDRSRIKAVLKDGQIVS